MKQDWRSREFVCCWKYYLPPARASPSDLRFIKKKILEKGKNPKVLILGSTPEYRELCGKLKIPIKLLDFSKKNYKYLAREVKHKPKETFIQGNWLDTKLKEKFDIILGDNVINMLKKKDIPKLLKNVSHMLEKDGLFMPRTYIRDKGEHYTPEQIIKEYREKNYRYGLYAGTARAIYITALKNEHYVMNDLYKIVKKLYKKGLITKKELEFYGKNLGWENRNFNFFMPLREKLNKLLSKYFKIVEIFNCSETFPFLKNKIPLHVLRRK
ncbi:hypothetical protein KY343_05430 [Candidatus Woesearchaeota archaeon]|nr:hypothetical protein [Candidatus Woesearchaeota archaeon]